MTSYMQSSFSIQTKANFDFLQQPSDSDSDDESKQMLKGTQQQNQQRDIKKQKKLIDIESLKSELGIRPIIENVNPENYYRRYSRKSIGTLTNMIIPTSSILIEQLSQIKKIKEIRKEVPPELLGRIYSEFRFQSVPQLNPVYRQGDQNKRYYIILEGKVVVMKPKEKMVGSNKLDYKENQAQKPAKKTEQDPYGLNNVFPDYIILKVLFQGDSFGEAAIKLDTARSSTVYALEQTHLIYLNEMAYLELINPYMSAALDNKINYFSKSPLFQNIEPQEFMGIILECKMITYHAGEIIFKEDDKATHLYFIIDGEIELSKKVGEKRIILSSYGQYQGFGEVEIMLKISRFTQAKVITPKLHVYRIRKRQYFDNLGNYQIFETMKKNSNLIFKHWQNRCEVAQQTIHQQDEIFKAAQDVQQNKPNFQAKHILNKKLVESQGQKLQQVKLLQNITDEDLKSIKIVNTQNQSVLQKVYSNTLQQYQARLLSKPQVVQQSHDENCIRNPFTIKTQADYLSENSTELNSITTRSSQPVIRTENVHQSYGQLPSIHLPQNLPLQIVFDTLSTLPRVNKDNLVLSLMYQQAFKSENPEKKAKQIQKVIQASYRNVQKQFESKMIPTNEINNISNNQSIDKRRLKFKSSGSNDLNSTRSNYVSFVQQKQLCSQIN
ncbi:unnamed protein product [Paramecium pentaurelia]|uniref:Cyclic nucleotide-binding domain-containing protein n=1 Tax=Paramecium pentaurelia TaxID=43138 RepID=A0A8S1X5N7_9CILI|nr:unnamed protein product [Paramecium pentaurelia]